jgi:adenosylcobinamide-GDP ribazoletransferase
MYDMTLAAILIAFALVFRLVFTKWLLARLGGFTGDCLGAAQQLVELMTYVLMLMVLMV